MSMNDNSINARFRWQTRLCSRCDFHPFCYTDGLFKKSMLVNFFSCGKKKFSAIFDFHFRENPCFRDKFQTLNNNNCTKKRDSRLSQSPHCAAHCLQHLRSSGQDTIVSKSYATHRALITCDISCAIWYKEQLS